MVSIKNKALKRLSTGLLASLLVLTTVFNSFASIGDSSQGNDVSGVITGNGGDFSANISGSKTSGKIGIRLSLVDRNNPETVISKRVNPLDGKLEPMVWDLLYVTQEAFRYQTEGSYNSTLFNQFRYSNVKTQRLMTSEGTAGVDKNVIVTTYYPDVINYTPKNPMPPWLAHSGDYYSNGKEFVEWCKTDDAGNQMIGSGAIYTTNPFGVPINMFELTVDEDKGEAELLAIDRYLGIKRRTYNLKGGKEEFLEGIQLNLDRIARQIGYQEGKEEAERLCDLYFKNSMIHGETLIEAWKTWYNQVTTQLDCIYILEKLCGKDSVEFKRMKEYYDTITSSAEFDVFTGYLSVKLNQRKDDVLTSECEKDLASRGIVASPYLAFIRNSALNGIDYMTNAGNNRGTSHIQKILETVAVQGENGTPTEYVLQTESMIEAHKNKTEMSLKNCKEDWVLLVEPLVWLTIYPQDTDRVPVHTKMYGTITNFAQAFTSDPVLLAGNYDKNKSFNWKALNIPVWSALTVDETGFAFSEEPNSLFFEYPQGIANGVRGYKSFQALANELNRVPKAVKVTKKDGTTVDQQMNTMVGYGVNVYWKDMFIDPGISTWDTDTYPEGDPGPAPDPTPLPDEPSYGIKSKDFVITKWYTIETEDENGEESEYVADVFTRKKTPHNVYILNEGTIGTDYYWEVVKWGTGKEPLAPEDGDTSTTFEDYYLSNKGKHRGTSPDTLIVKPGEEDSILYVKLVRREIITVEPGDLKIVKVKDNPDGTTTVTTEEGTSTDGKYNANETGWTYLEDMQTSKDPATVNKWTDVPVDGTPGATPDITVKEDTKTIYIHYTQDNPTIPGKSPIVLHQNELSRGYTLQSLVANGTLASLQERFISLAGSVMLCGGHHVSCSNHRGGHTRHGGSTSRKIDDGNYTLSLTSSNTNPNFILDYEQVGDTWRVWGVLGISGGNSHLLTPNASYLLYRDKAKDLITPYPGKNTDRAILNKLGIGADSAVPRARINTTGAGKFYNKFATNFTKASDYDHTLNWKWYCSYKGRYEEWGYWDGYQVSGKTISGINEAYTYDNNVEIRYELGTVGQGLTAPQNTREIDFANVFYNNPFVSVQQDGDIIFYPYTKMQYYDKSNSEAGKKDIFATSTNTSTIKAFTKIESGVWKNSGHDDATVNGSNPDPNIKLDSTQWSTHKNSLSFLDEMDADDKKAILPGGATFDVSMKADTSEWGGESGDKPTTSTKLGYRVWQTCIEDGRTSLLAPNSTVQTVTEAKQRVNELDNSIKDAIPSYGLVQTIMKGAVDYEGYLGNYTQGATYEVVTNGGTWNSIPLSSDAKYYLKLLENKGAGQEFNSSITNFDILKGGIVKQKLYTIGSDTQGDVYVLLDGTEIGRIHSTGTVEQLLNQNTDIKLVDNATKIVTNYIKAIDRNRGADRNGKAWYNEAFDGVNVLYSYLSYDIGFGNGIAGSPGAGGKGTAVRSAILDPKLTGKLDNKSDLYNFAEDSRDAKVRSSMILTGQAGVANGLKQPTGEIGKMTLKNGGTIQVKLENMSIFAYSKMFYIPNANVSDLN